MKSRHFKIRSSQSQSQEQPKIKKESDKNIMLPIGESHEFSYHDDDNQYKEFFKMFKTIMDKDKISRAQPDNAYKTDLEPRDREIIIEAPSTINNVIPEVELKKWIAQVFKTVTSASFNYYSKKEMNFQQAKIFCSENIFKNITNLCKYYSLSAKELAIIDHHIEKGVLTYLGAKYPLTDNANLNKKLQEIIHQVDNIQALPNNIINSTSVIFQYRDDGNYNDLIMMLLNELMEYLDQETDDQKTNYHEFEEFMTRIFQKVMDEDWMQKKDKEQLMSNLKLSHQKSDISSSPNKLQFHQSFQADNLEDYKEKLRKRNEEKEKYRANVKQYTHYLIGRKIPQHSLKYTQKEIQSKNMTIKSPTILRILTKWCEELWQKYSQVGYYANRSESIKVLKGGNVNSLLSWMRDSIDSKLEVEKQEIIKFTNQIQENNYEMQSKILKSQLSIQDCDYVQQLQKACGKFSTKVVKNVHSYIIAYLNRLIHGLMSVSKQFHTQNDLGQFSFWPSPPNLLTFRLGDLMRCKISSKEKEIVRIYKQIQKISKEHPEKFKVIRIKNRLKKGTNDILINFKFNNFILCEVQLAVKGYTSNFIKCSNDFHHYLYQLQRSNFGPLTQLCSIWNNLDKRTQIYQEMIQEQKKHYKPAEHVCKKLSKKTIMKVYLKPFICNECSLAYFHNNYLKNHLKCANCQFYVCANCQIEKKPSQQLTQQLILDVELRARVIRKINKNERLPQHGLCVFLQSKIPKSEFFMYERYANTKKDYLLGVKNGQIYQIQNIQTPRASKQFRRKHVIFQINSHYSPEAKVNLKAEINTFILTKIIQNNFKKQKQSISLMDRQLNEEDCRKILSGGTKPQKENVRNLFLTDNILNKLPFDPQEFPNISWLTLSRNLGIQLAGIEKLTQLKNLITVSIGISSIPEEVYQLTSIQELSMTQNTISRVQDKIGNLKKLIVLELDNNALTQISGQIKQCKALSSFKVESNLLTELPEELFTLQNLQMLLLSANSLSSLSNSIGKLTKLKQLNVSNNSSIIELPEPISNLISLQKLNVAYTGISKLPQGFSKLWNITELSISYTNIQSISPDILNLKKMQKLQIAGLRTLENIHLVGQFVQLKSLDMSGCNLTSIPSQLKNLVHLQYFNVSSNPLNAFDPSFFEKMVVLYRLNASSCQLTAAPNLAKQQLLTHIDLSNNRITEIPNQNLEECKFLQNFMISNNQLTCLPDCFKDFNKIIKLDLKVNQLATILKAELEQSLNNSEAVIWPKMTDLYLNQNKLTSLPKYVCRNSKIVQLYFSSNNIAYIPAEISHLKNLRQIQANYNQITELPQGFAGLQKLIGIYMSFNSINHLSDVITRIPQLQTLYLDSCPLEAIDCVDWIIEKGYQANFGQLLTLAQNLKYNQNPGEEAQSKNNQEGQVVEDKAGNNQEQEIT